MIEPLIPITKENYKQALFEFTKKKYRIQLKQFYQQFKSEFPYDYISDNEELAFKNWIDWLIIEKTLPTTGKTIVEQFIDEHHNLPQEMKQSMQQMKNIVRGKFNVVSIRKKELVLSSIKTTQQYHVLLYNEAPFLKKGSSIEGRIHPFDTHYRFCGAYNSQSPR